MKAVEATNLFKVLRATVWRRVPAAIAAEDGWCAADDAPGEIHNPKCGERVRLMKVDDFISGHRGRATVTEIEGAGSLDMARSSI